MVIGGGNIFRGLAASASGMERASADYMGMLATMLPRYRAEGKTRLSVAIGCTGGKHRSVCMTEKAAAFLQDRFPAYNIVVGHREVFRWAEQSGQEAKRSVGETC